MAEGTDRRKKRTRQLLRKALLDLIEERGLDRITVRDLTERAEINRGTFYLHYRDVPDLMEQLKQEIFEGLTQVAVKLQPSELQKHAEQDLVYPPMVQLLSYFKSNGDFFHVMFGPNGDFGFPMQIKAFMKERLYLHLFDDLPEDASAPVPRDYLIAFIASANIGLLTHWIQSGMDLPVEEVALILARILHRGPLAVSAFS
ncbi:TetR/AcrR family transcriptional regulator [Tumebacillus flagellatus]|uniref:HTH tetR-type domain-containing protein n=1 Tax=Tumebacillus flagellatus TaxID=1157490 RepID=A0A074MHH8_9BACL|nr:TetR/AcrR family transcriptional regulator [Tumebacillus flagellatus]KEO85102.1 hypothetical protein EL26_00640 [Tumebacillus flagellatus]